MTRFPSQKHLSHRPPPCASVTARMSARSAARAWSTMRALSSVGKLKRVVRGGGEEEGEGEDVEKELSLSQEGMLGECWERRAVGTEGVDWVRSFESDGELQERSHVSAVVPSSLPCLPCAQRPRTRAFAQAHAHGNTVQPLGQT